MPDDSPETATPAQADVDEPSSALRVLVAGGTGFLGAAFVRELDRRGHRVTVLSRRPEKVSNRFPGRSIEGRVGDVTLPETLLAALEGIDAVIHSVQFPGFPVEDPSVGRTFLEVDAGGSANMATAAGRAGVGKLVYLSGVGADSRSSLEWFRAKGLAEEAMAASGVPYTNVRPSWAYGPEDDSLNRFVKVIRRVPLFFPQLGNGHQRINPIFVEDLARVVVEATVRPGVAENTTFEIGGPATYRMDGIIRLVMDVLDRRKPILHLPLPLVRGGALVLERFPGQILSRDAVTFVTQHAVANNSRFRKLFPGAPLTPMPAALASYLVPGVKPHDERNLS